MRIELFRYALVGKQNAFYSSGQKGKEQLVAFLFHGGLALFKEHCYLEILGSKLNEEFEVSGQQQKRVTKQNKRSCNNEQKREREFVRRHITSTCVPSFETLFGKPASKITDFKDFILSLSEAFTRT